MDASQAADQVLSTWEWLGIIGFILAMSGGLIVMLANMLMRRINVMGEKLDRTSDRVIAIMSKLNIQDIS